MFRAKVNRVKVLISKLTPLKRSYSEQPPITVYVPVSGRIPVLGPVIWSLGACGTIYLGCAAYEVYHDMKRAEAKGSRWDRGQVIQTFEQLERLSGTQRANSMLDTMGRSTSERPEFSDSMKLTMRIMAANAAVHLARGINPFLRVHFVHIPAFGMNHTLLTSVFAHGGLVHLGLNMYGLFYFLPSAAYSPTFKGSNAHLTAFYLSAGVLSSLAQHMTAIWPRRNISLSSMGASGAIFALLGIVGVSFPHTQIGIIFLPGSLPVGQAMACIAVFDAIGIFVRYPGVRLGHAAHLSGLALGVGYAKYGGDKRIWRPGRKFAFEAMRFIGFL
ncbi:hypothetical protein GGR55DRAFT_612883 [Xylaria sp. FL0064]|nr:hypothetical protein GGR55DRAFT_612883 [Xylaria sp. FL0064]